jgi:hypothetical protein
MSGDVISYGIVPWRWCKEIVEEHLAQMKAVDGLQTRVPYGASFSANRFTYSSTKCMGFLN